MSARLLTVLGAAIVVVAAARGAVAADVDAVVRAPKPLIVKLGAGTVAAETKIAVEVANAASGAAGATFRLVVGDGDCPPGIVTGAPDFGKKNAGTPDIVTLLPGKKAKATIKITPTAPAFTSPAPKLPTRCTLTLTASATEPAGATDPSPANATATLAIDVLDANDAAPPALAEVLTTNPKPVLVTAAAGKVVTKSLKLTVANASSGGGPGTPDADITLVTLGGDCPTGVTAGVDLDKKAAGVQTSGKVLAGKKAAGTLALAIDASRFPPGSKTSPARCTLTVGVAASASGNLSNDLTRVVLDVSGGTGAVPVPNRTPAASFTVGPTGTTFAPVTFDGTTSSDPDGDPLTYQWSFGDGVAGAVATLAHAYTQAGPFLVRLTVADGRGGSAFTEQQVTIGAGATAQGTAPAAGVVRTVAGTPLAGVGIVADGGGTGTTDASGKATVNVPRGVPFKLTFTKSGYATQYLPYVVPAGTDGAIFEVTMITQEPAQTVNATLGGTVAGKDGATLILPPNGLVTGNGTPVTGPVSVAITPVDPVSAPESFPGRYAGFDASGQEGLLLSYGTVQYELTKSGAPVNLAPGATATLEIPIYATLDKTGAGIVPGAVIPLWSLDERTGAWVQEGTGTVVAANGSPSGIALRGTVGHLSWWNCDKFEDPPYKPKPKCMVDTNADGVLEDLTGTGHCWNAGTGTEQPPPLLGTSRRLPGAAAPLVLPRVPAFAAQASIPAAGGVVLPVPADFDITIRASAKNGTLVGTKVLRGAANVEEEVRILLEPLAFEDAVPITIPWNAPYTMPVGVVHQYRFDAAKDDPIFVTVSRGGGSSLAGGVIVQGPSDFEIGPASFAIANGALAFLAPAAGRYRIVIDGTAGEPGGYHLRVGSTGTIPLLLSTSPLAGASGVALSSLVSANFFAALDPTSVTAADPAPTFRLFGPLGVVAGTAAATGATATFTPTSPLEPGLAYTARLTTGIRSNGGDTLPSQYEWGFTTSGDPGPVVPIGTGSNFDLGIAPNGQAFIAFKQDHPSGARGTSVSRFTPGVGWQAPVVLRSENIARPDLAVSADGSAIVVWRFGDGSASAIFASRYTAAGGWSAAELLAPASASLAQAFPKVAIDAVGNAIAGWRVGTAIHTRRYDAGTGWSAVETLFAAASQPIFESFDLTVAPDGRAVAARIQAGVVVVRRFAPSTGWAAEESISQAGTFYLVRAGLDAVGNVLVMWKSPSEWSWRRYDAATEAWNSAQTLLADSTSQVVGALYDAQLLVLPNGNAIAASQQSDGPLQRIWSMRFDTTAGTWTTPEAIVSTVTCAFMLASSADGALGYAAWITCFTPPNAIAWKKYTTATGWAATETPIPPQNAIEDGVIRVAVAPDLSGLLVFRRNADSAVLAAPLE